MLGVGPATTQSIVISSTRGTPSGTMRSSNPINHEDSSNPLIPTATPRTRLSVRSCRASLRFARKTV